MTEMTRPIGFSTAESQITFVNKGYEQKGKGVLSMIFGILLQYALVLMMSLGAVLTFTSMFSVPFHWATVCTAVAAASLVMVLLYQLPKKVMWFSLLGAVILLIAAFFVWRTEISAGLVYCRDYALLGISDSMCWSMTELPYTFSEAMKADTDAALSFVGAVLGVIVGFAVSRISNFWLGFLVTFPFFEAGAAFGCVPDHLCFAPLLAAWVGLFAMYLAARIDRIRRRRHRGKREATAAVQSRFGTVFVGVLMAALTLAVYLGFNTYLTKNGYDRPESVRAYRHLIQDTVENWVDYLSGEDNDGSLKEGRLYKMGDRVIKNRHYMTVEIKHYNKSYLRGYVGAEYTGRSWQDISDGADTELLKFYQSSGLYPQKYMGKLFDSANEKFPVICRDYSTIRISDLRRKKDYAYTGTIPIFQEKSPAFSFAGDTKVIPKNKKSYASDAYLGKLDTEVLFQLAASDVYNDKDFTAAMETYSKYVNQEYTKLPEKGLERVKELTDKLVSGKAAGYDLRSASVLETADRIREYLKNNVAYSFKSTKSPESAEFVDRLLFETKTGYSAHFATAMAVMLRQAGVPARYIEGYYISDNDFTGTKPLGDSYYRLNLTDANAHAWIEMYLDGYGWLTVDATPGFYDESLMEQYERLLDDFEMKETKETTEIKGDVDEDENSDATVFIIPPDIGSMDNDPNTDSIYIKDKYKVWRILGWTVGTLLVLAILALIVLLIRRAWRLNRLRKGLYSGPKEEQLCRAYRCYRRLLAFEGIVALPSTPYLEFAETVKKSCHYLTDEQHDALMAAFLQFRFADHALSTDEVRDVVRKIDKYRTDLAFSLKGKDRLRFKLIENLG